MKVHQIEIDTITAPGDFLSFLENNDVQRGDTVKLVTSARQIVLYILSFIYVALYWYYTAKKKRQEDGDQILDALFKDRSSGEIELEIEHQYGIKIETAYIDEETGHWQSLSQRHFINSYAASEPDYDLMIVKEPNPSYQAWKAK